MIFLQIDLEFWPWHHEPDTWAVNMLWALDDFTEANGGTQVRKRQFCAIVYLKNHLFAKTGSGQP
jgi:hypothetical protein